jgi:hypothetical protein
MRGGGSVTHDRRAALDGLARILDAGAPEELFSGPDHEARFLFELLVDVARARSSSYYWEVCRTARKRGVTPEYVADRAAVLLATIEERRRTDLYRILGVPGLASGEVIRRRWLEVAKLHHPDVGGEGAAFRHAKQAYEVLRDPSRRASYERFWRRALGPFEHIAPGEQVSAPTVAEPPPVPTSAPPPQVDIRDAVARLFAARAQLDTHLATVGGLAGVVERFEARLGQLSADDLRQARARVQRTMGDLEALRAELRTLAALKRALAA